MFSRFAIKTAAVFFAAIVTTLVSFAPTAQAVSYTTSGFSLSNLGGSGTFLGYLSGLGTGGTFIDGGTINLNYLTFAAVNTGLATNNNYSIAETMTVSGAGGQNITIPFNLSINRSDTLTVAGGTTFSFLTGGSLWQVVVNGLTLATSGPGGAVSGWLTGTVTDPPAGEGVSQAPLPAALPLFASGLGVMGLFGWWRKRKATAATV